MDTTYDTQIEQSVQSIFSSMLGMEVVRSAEGAAACDECVLGTIQITGERSMSVILGVSEGAARAATSAMLMLPIHDVTENDSLDVVAELANMIGGNLKS